MRQFLQLEHLPHGLRKPGFPGSLPGVIVREVGEVSWGVEAVGAIWRLSHACLMDCHDDRDEGFSFRYLVGHVVEVGEVKVRIRICRIGAPGDGAGDVGWGIVVEDLLGFVGAFQHSATFFAGL